MAEIIDALERYSRDIKEKLDSEREEYDEDGQIEGVQEGLGQGFNSPDTVD